MTVRGLSVLLFVLLAVGASSLVWWRCEGEAPRVDAPEALAVGREGTEVKLGFADDRSGLRQVRVVLRHASGEAVLRDDLHPGSLVSGAVRKPSREDVSLTIDPQALGLPEGDAFLDAEAVDWSWREWLSGNVTRVSVPVEIDLTPPRVFVESGLTYVRRGGAAAVSYELDAPVARDGVEVGDAFFPGFAHPGTPEGSSGRRFALFAVPRDASESPPIHVVAVDRAGNRTTARWATRVQERSFEDVRINLGESFLEGKVPSLAGSLGIGAADPVAAFQDINTRIRAENEERVRAVVARGGATRLWEGAFRQLRNSAVTSRFAEHRRYFFRDAQISEAIHYGYDLASTARDSITASNAGRVLFAGDLGIYGNCVILDHGLGLTSLYAHLSSLDVSEGAEVARGDVLGLSGTTGLAGGDHLHFAILVSGVYVDPKEWWDPKWVREHVEVHLPPKGS